MNPPLADEYAPYYQSYIDAVSDNVIADLESQIISFPEFLRGLPADKISFAYAEGKWTVMEVVGHIIDTERIMAYRALRIGRGDKTPLPGFEENDYVVNTRFEERTINDLAEEFVQLRKANMYLVRSFNDEDLKLRGICSNHLVSVKALLYILAGHLSHHRRIIEERYL